jgi:hypothetical protein
MGLLGAEGWDWYCMADPSTSTGAFAVLFIAYDQTKPFALCVDEIYETEALKVTVAHISERILKITEKYCPDNRFWKFYYDPAGRMFANESNLRFGIPWVGANKRPNEKDDGIIDLEEAFENRQILFSTRCSNAAWEIDNYYKDKNGRYIKRHDHQIDNLRYFVMTVGFFSRKRKDLELRIDNMRKGKGRRAYTNLTQDLKEMRGQHWAHRILDKYGEYD